MKKPDTTGLENLFFSLFLRMLMNGLKMGLHNPSFLPRLLAIGFITIILCFFNVEKPLCAAIVTAGPDWEYTAHMLDKVSARWQPPKQLVGLHRLNLALSLDSDGRLLECKVQNASGLDALDASACAAAWDASPFGPPPSRRPAVVHFSFWTGGLDSRVPISDEKEHYNPIFAERAVENARFANERAQARAEAAAKSSGKLMPEVPSKPLPDSGQSISLDDKAALVKEHAKARAETAIEGVEAPHSVQSVPSPAGEAAKTVDMAQPKGNQVQEAEGASPFSKQLSVLPDNKSTFSTAQLGAADDKSAIAKEQARARAEAAMRGAVEEGASPTPSVVSPMAEPENKLTHASTTKENEAAQVADKTSSSTVQRQTGSGNPTLVKDRIQPQSFATLKEQLKPSLQAEIAKPAEIEKLPNAIQPVEDQLEQKKAEPVRDLPAPLPASTQSASQNVTPPQKELSETEKLAFEKYEARITSILRKGIFVPRGPTPDTLYSTVQLDLDRKGKILKSSIVSSSGDARLDRNILKAIQPGKILPPPPPGRNNQFVLTFSLARKKF